MIKLLTEIGFTEEQLELYKSYKEQYKDKLDEIKSDYLNQKININEALQAAKDTLPDVHPHTVELLFVIECFPAMKENHLKKGLSEKIFLDSARDLTYKIRECYDLTGVFGIRVGWWYDRFIFATRLTFSRLQYDVNVYGGETVEYAGNTLEKGDFVLDCHIHSGGRLLEEDCIASYREAWEFFCDKTKNGVLPIICLSWLLFPDYMAVFGENSNTGRFARHFYIYRTDCDESRASAVLNNVFNTTEFSDKLPCDTSMQRKFIEYFKTSKSFGIGAGVIFFDGESILTKR